MTDQSTTAAQPAATTPDVTPTAAPATSVPLFVIPGQVYSGKTPDRVLELRDVPDTGTMPYAQPNQSKRPAAPAVAIASPDRHVTVDTRTLESDWKNFWLWVLGIIALVAICACFWALNKDSSVPVKPVAAVSTQAPAATAPVINNILPAPVAPPAQPLTSSRECSWTGQLDCFINTGNGRFDFILPSRAVITYQCPTGNDGGHKCLNAGRGKERRPDGILANYRMITIYHGRAVATWF